MKKVRKDVPRWEPEGKYLHGVGLTCGITLYSLLAANSDITLGSVWIKPQTDHFGRIYAEIVDIYVPNAYRRRGFGRYLIEQMLEMYGSVKTGTGSDSGGMALMKAMGFKLNNLSGDWWLRTKIRWLPGKGPKTRTKVNR